MRTERRSNAKTTEDPGSGLMVLETSAGPLQTNRAIQSIGTESNRIQFISIPILFNAVLKKNFLCVRIETALTIVIAAVTKAAAFLSFASFDVP